MDFDQPPVVRVEADERLDARAWPMTVPAVAQVVREGLDLPKGVTFLVGENGSGKSTLVEAIAVAFGLSPEGGTAQGHHSTRPTESPLHTALRLQRGIGAARWGFFLRAETMHGWYSFLESNRVPWAENRDAAYHEMSHGESFLELLRTRFDSPGFYCLDEPEAALSFSSTLGLISVLDRVVGEGGQVLCATHSPVLAAMPGATILEVGDAGLHRTTWAELDLVQHWRRYLDDPQRYLRHVLD
ncbi:AAA family ATPase [Pimelobacter simplex]|uniref:Putative ABC iron siderophore transporter, fused permease and ATPase domains n=1 Tax=Nocardioides simplex TaxID=2045 RepID=A0A0A1DJU0_NOCSI|nr:AAA family ATPase [Pimelobacter simplex]AIY17676.1 Putative ABC iron siderophore transporter, fused permease and ATPase domains [Pimelobacter simplex]GEB13675.1 ABC transporter, ATP-binding protein [Pimelobacter simplex]SFM70148.1 Predicted ATPase [Pimelobacter simplex]